MFDLFVSDTLRFAHLLSIAVGFGVAVETEAFLFRRRRTGISPGLLSGLDHRHRVILYALAAMWVTGLALVALRTGFQISTFTPKLWGKITVVTILTINALFVSKVALPILAEHKGRRIAALPPGQKNALFSVAGVSAASWLIALGLGSSAILKVSPGVVFQIGLPLAYIAGILGANWVGRRLFPSPLTPTAQTAANAAARSVPAAPLASARAAPSSERANAAQRQNQNASPPEQIQERMRGSRPASRSIPADPDPKTAAVRRPTTGSPAPRASDLAIAFAPNLKPGAPRLRVEPDDTHATQAARERLAGVLAELGAR